MPHSTARNDDDDMSDLVKISPPSSSPSLMSYTETVPSMKSVSEGGYRSHSHSQSHSEIGSRASSFDSSEPSGESTISSASMAAPSNQVQRHDDEHVDIGRPSVQGVRSDEEVVKDVRGAVEGTVRRVREQSDKFQLAARPYADKIRSFAENRPVLFTFIALWMIISAIPVALFLGFAILATLTVASIAAFFVAASVIGIILFAVAALAGTVLFAMTFLLPVLLVTTALTLMALSTLLSLFLAHRLYLHLSVSTSKAADLNVHTLSVGIRAFIEETLERINLKLPGFLANLTEAKPVQEKVGLRWGDDNDGQWTIDEKKDMDGGDQTPSILKQGGWSFDDEKTKASGKGYKYNVSVPLPLGSKKGPIEAPVEHWGLNNS
ncbi:hypothetical protein IAR55_001830 [Kwoniella newhampshirensis]|uniref:Transmembrane protein n=1 Tax=Kwoniella newhampshirensis TaxID=1651941 RepID=A0AAW0Z398_9TREE